MHNTVNQKIELFFIISISTAALNLTSLTVVIFSEYHVGMLLYLSNVITILVSTCSLVQLMLAITQNIRTWKRPTRITESNSKYPHCNLSLQKSRNHKPQMSKHFPISYLQYILYILHILQFLGCRFFILDF